MPIEEQNQSEQLDESQNESLPNHNTGVILGSGTKSLWAGGQIPYEVVLESGDWRPFVVRHEKQKDPVETMACVSFSLNNVLEILHKFRGIDINFSDRFLAKTSGTSEWGNQLDVVADTARKKGLVLESEYPNLPKAQTWAEYYKTIPNDILAKARPQNISFAQIPHTIESLQSHLKQAPIQVVVSVNGFYHAVTLLYIARDKAYCQDHYSQQIRVYNTSVISYALKVVLNKTTMNEFAKTMNYKGTVGVFIAADNVENFKFLAKSYGVEAKVKPDGTIETDINIS